jgi:hypothetical protein
METAAEISGMGHTVKRAGLFTLGVALFAVLMMATASMAQVRPVDAAARQEFLKKLAAAAWNERNT